MSQSEYYKRRYQERRALAHQMLGGKCAVCGATEGLCVVHADSSTYRFNPMTHTNRALKPWTREVKKCVLYCRTHQVQDAHIRQGHLPVSVHGTDSKYAAGCRCDECRAAHAFAQLRLNEQRQRRGVPPSVPHGSTSTYNNYNCRCEPCKQAKAKQWAAWRARKKAVAA